MYQARCFSYPIHVSNQTNNDFVSDIKSFNMGRVIIVWILLNESHINNVILRDISLKITLTQIGSWRESL